MTYFLANVMNSSPSYSRDCVTKFCFVPRHVKVAPELNGHGPNFGKKKSVLASKSTYFCKSS